MRLVFFVATTVIALAVALPASAGAAFPGDNGKIAFAVGGIHTINPDGSGETALTTIGIEPSWSADATKIAYIAWNGDGTLHVVNADGTGDHSLGAGTRGRSPSWSPDGTQLAFMRDWDIWKVNADGTGLARITADWDESGMTCDPAFQGGYGSWPPCPINSEPAWSPSGNKVAYVHQGWEYDYDFERWNQTPPEVHTIDPDGANRTVVRRGATAPNWSPDGTRIVFECPAGICVMTSSGTLLGSALRGTGSNPVWSPDARKIAFTDRPSGTNDPYRIYVMNADGGGATRITTNALNNVGDPDWQPLRPYPRPVGASPLEIAFVQAFRPCETGNANGQHGPPLGFPSCSNPTPTSSTVRIGPNTLSIARIVVCPSNASSTFCNPPAGMPKPDVRFAGSIRDVRCASAVPAGCTPGGDYNPNTSPGPYTDAGNGKGGAQPPCLPSASSTTACLAGADLTEVAEIPGASLGGAGTQFEGRGVRITDRSNIPVTVTDIGFPVPLDCLPTASTTQGSTCGVNTTANALVPGVVTAGDTAVWQIGQVELRDSGPDGVRGNSDDELFATQGVFLP